MSDMDPIKAGFLGALIGAIVTAIAIAAYISPETPANIRSLKDACEARLPRTQNCIMWFVPEPTNKP